MSPNSKKPSLKSWMTMILIGGVLSGIIIFFATLFISPNGVKLPGLTKRPSSGGIHLDPGDPGDRVILVMGVDSNNEALKRKKAEESKKKGTQPSRRRKDFFDGVRTDTIILARLSTHKNTVSLVSIPRDSKVFYSQRRGIGKINAAYAFGGIDLALNTVEDAFGIPIDNYVVVDSQGIKEVVDALGGVRVYVEKPLKYRDRTAKLNIDLKKGYHQMNGEQAEGFLRFRHDALGDIGRIRRQQYFLKAVHEKARNPWFFAKIPGLVDLINRYVETDLSLEEMAQLAWFLKDFDIQSFRSGTLPGYPSQEEGISYWIINPSLAQTVLDRLILDNPYPPKIMLNHQAKPIQVGVFYEPSVKKQAEAFEKILSKVDGTPGFQIVCMQEASQTSGTRIIEHTPRVNDGLTQKLRSAYKPLENARLIFAPLGSTFEKDLCNLREDYTVTFGDDIQ